ncbi:MAG: hypothetical protein WC622_16625 [Pedobacter sp.]|jgi:hypothetical protein|uniref:hypothetical protein n=1 Tax=Pedobacter sp. TaxID=1411316 RepID=UPI00356650A0
MKNLFLFLLISISFNSFGQNAQENNQTAQSASKGESELTAGMKAYQNQDGRTAAEWFKKAVAKGSLEATYRLGVVYGYQQYGVFSKDSLNYWFKKAWLAGHPKAKDEWLMLRRDRRMQSMADWKTIIENKVSVAQKQWVNVTSWNLVADDRYYSIGPIRSKKNSDILPEGAEIFFRILGKNRIEVANGKANSFDSYTFKIQQSGDYTIEAYYDCSECTTSRKPSAFTMFYRMAMWNYDLTNF